MSQRRPVTVVNITSPSYTGTTWLCLLLGSHPRALALGPPDPVWSRLDGGDGVCRVHGASCPFWPAFFESYRPHESFYLQLADASGRDVIVINNPGREHAEDELSHPDLAVRRLQLVRDGRAIACSYARHHDVDFYDAVRDYVAGIYSDFPFERDRADVLALRYEDVVADQRGHLRRLGEFIGLDYGDDALRFWEHEHHVTSGNAGAIMLLKLFQGIDVPEGGRDRSFYRQQHERMMRNGQTFNDERWKAELGPRERFVFDCCCGGDNAAWGYPEDAFTSTERDRFAQEQAVDLRPAAATLRRGVRRLHDRAADVATRVPRGRRRLAWLLVLAWVVSIIVTWTLAVVTTS